jgi:hypothetical protein
MVQYVELYQGSKGSLGCPLEAPFLESINQLSLYIEDEHEGSTHAKP